KKGFVLRNWTVFVPETVFSQRRNPGFPKVRPSLSSPPKCLWKRFSSPDRLSFRRQESSRGISWHIFCKNQPEIEILWIKGLRGMRHCFPVNRAKDIG
ncbi:MAG: hypothetical protein RBT82_06585, partial [Desulfomonilia bacterium]|nr:hypothetical protein [Desulfomonilia bacterium]